MNNVDTIYLKDDLLVEKLCGGNDGVSFVLTHTTTHVCHNAVTITHIVCVTVIVVALLIVAGLVIKPWIENSYRYRKKESERKDKELEYLKNLLKAYSSKLYEVFSKWVEVLGNDGK